MVSENLILFFWPNLVYFLICVCFACTSDEERLYNLTKISWFFLSKLFSETISCDVTITARGKEKCRATYTGNGNIPELFTVAPCQHSEVS